MAKQAPDELPRFAFNTRTFVIKWSRTVNTMAYSAIHRVAAHGNRLVIVSAEGRVEFPMASESAAADAAECVARGMEEGS